ncbi:ABC transporter ATP-binding protein [Streptacidiphilus sp. PAMC 29251]
MIEAKNLTKCYGGKTVVDDLSFTVRPGRVTGFLGPNGAGKSTTMRLLLGLDRPDHGEATVNGQHYRDLPQPMRVVGAMLEARAVHTGRRAYDHLLCLAQTQGLGKRRVEDVIEQVGLTTVARKRAGGFSLGMGQRLGIAVALLGDPALLILDEPLNGLDPEGIVWIRNLMKAQAARGRAVFVSSHLMNEMAVTADHLVVIGRGRLVADCSTEEFIEHSTKQSVLVKCAGPEQLAELLRAEGGTVTDNGVDGLDVTGLDAPRIAELAAFAGLTLHELTRRRGSLEDAFMELTRHTVEYDTTLATTGAEK